jgi:hypothetical protein
MNHGDGKRKWCLEAERWRRHLTNRKEGLNDARLDVPKRSRNQRKPTVFCIVLQIAVGFFFI